MLQKTLLLSVAQLLALSTAVSIPSPVLTDPEAEADRAEVAGLMRTEFYKGAEYYYLFVTNEYSGSKLLRQSICDVYTDPKTELSEGAPCRDIWQMPYIEGDLSFEELRKIKHYITSDRYEMEESSYIGDDESGPLAQNTLGINITRVRSDRSFDFSVLSGPGAGIPSEGIKVAATQWTCEEDDYTGDNDCLWTPPASTNKQIRPYSWIAGLSYPTTDPSKEPGWTRPGFPDDEFERVQQDFEGLTPDEDYNYSLEQTK